MCKMMGFHSAGHNLLFDCLLALVIVDPKIVFRSIHLKSLGLTLALTP